MAVDCREHKVTADLSLSFSIRFCGPATAVEIPTVMGPHKVIIKTTGQSVAETGLQFSILALYPAQLRVLQSGAQRVFITGPPGTGKTVVLALKARQWALDRKVVHVVSTHYKGRAVSALLQQQVIRAITRGRAVDASMVRTHNYDFDDSSKNDVDKAVSNLSECAVGGELFVIVDEVGSTHRSASPAPTPHTTSCFTCNSFSFSPLLPPPPKVDLVRLLVGSRRPLRH